MFRNLFVLLCLLGSSLAMAAGGIRVGMSADYPPLHYKQDGQVVGIEADNATAVSKITGLKVEIVELPFAQLIPSLLSGDIDAIMSGMSVTPIPAPTICTSVESELPSISAPGRLSPNWQNDSA